VVELGPEKEVSRCFTSRLDKKLTKVEEELHENVKREHSMAGEMFVGESPNDEENSKGNESHQLDRLASNGVDSGNSHPVAWDGTSTNENAVTSGQVVKDSVNIWSSTVANGREHSGGVKTKTVKLRASMSI
jgi:hypothetical protein